MASLPALRVGIMTQGLEERSDGGVVRIANGGVGVYIHELLRHLAMLEPPLELFSIRLGAAQLEVHRATNIQPHFLPLGRLRNRLFQFDYPLARLARTLKLDLLHFPNQFGGVFLPRSIKRVVTVHDLTPLTFPQFHPPQRVKGFRFFLNAALRRADQIIVDARYTASEISRRLPAVASKINVVPLGVSPHFAPRSDARNTLPFDLPERFVLSVGVLEPRKNHILLARALSLLRRNGEEVGLVIVGREGWKWSDPLSVPELSWLRPHVRILRDVSDEDLAALYSRAAAFAYPSHCEGFGLPVLEAMACGTPVVASSVSALPEVVGDAGLLVDPHSAEDLATKLTAVLHEGETRRRLIARGLERAAQFTWTKTAQQTLAVYRQAVR